MQDLRERFTHHPPKGNDREFYEAVRSACFDLACLVVGSTLASREQSLAVTKLEEACMWANAARARHATTLPIQRFVPDPLPQGRS